MISAVIPSYKNVPQLIANLRHNLPFLGDAEVIVVNDYPAESIKKELSHFPHIRLIENTKNLGFAGAVHVGIMASRGTHILLLNSDVILQNNSYTKALASFELNKKLFAVSFCQKEKDGKSVGKNRIFWKNGFFQHAQGFDIPENINGWAEGGASLIDKEKYISLGGFDTLYSPFYWEDIDLSYRAWKQGYEIYYNHDVQVIHHHESTIGKYFNRFNIYKIVYRNQFTFIWKNINDAHMVWSHIRWMALMLPVMLIKDPAFAVGFVMALVRLPQILKKRKQYPLSDTNILNKFNRI